MAKLRFSPAAGLFATVVGMSVSFVSAVQACPFSGNKLPTQTTYSPETPGQMSGNATQVSGLQLMGMNSNQLGIGLGIATVGLITAGVVYRIRCGYQSAHLSESALFEHPELSHPEVALTSLPKEALASFSAAHDVILTR
jgi:hypothetical protein